jgi:hypothetical protein
LAAEDLLTPDDFHAYIEELIGAGLEFFVIGGQAVNLVAEFFVREREELEPFYPLTSKDFDVRIQESSYKLVESQLSGRVFKSDDPSQGQLYIWQPVAGREIDFLTNVYGIPRSRQADLYKRSLDLGGGLRVLSPIDQFQSKAACYLDLQLANHADRQDDKHLHILGLVLHDYFDYLLEQCDGSAVQQRAILKAINEFRGIAAEAKPVRAMIELGLNAERMIPIPRLRSCGFEKVERFARETWGD